jgi:hypothetical protein
MKENRSLALNIVETNDFKNTRKPFFAHSKIGENLKPKTKIDDFANIIDRNSGSKIDIAFIKLCYVDVSEGSNIEDIFSYYKNSVNGLIKKHPGIKFVHITLPLTTTIGVDTGMKAKIKGLIKNLIGRTTARAIDNDANINRFRYNELLINEYGEKNVFDLASYESTTPDGKRQSFKHDGRNYYELVPSYTFDGGHLNESGRKFIAEQLLYFLINLD